MLRVSRRRVRRMLATAPTRREVLDLITRVEAELARRHVDVELELRRAREHS